MTFPGWLTIFGFVVDPHGARAAARALHGRRLHRRAHLPRSGPAAARAPALPGHARRPEQGQDWKAYAKSLIIFSLAGWLLLYLILRTQTLWDFTGLNPQGFHSAPGM